VGLISTSQERDFDVIIGSLFKISVQSSAAVKKKTDEMLRITREETD